MLWLHLSAIVLWIGGMFAIPFVAAPAIRRSFGPDEAEELVERLVRRFLRFSRELILVVFLTGLFSVLSIGYATQFAYSERFLWLVGAKFVLFVILAANQTWYGLRLVPQRRKPLATASSITGAGLAAVVIYLAVILRGG